jgi:hypothetical protein
MPTKSAKSINEDFLFDDLEDEEEKEESEIEDDDEESNCEFDNLDPDQYYFKISDDDGYNYIVLIPITWFDENQTSYDEPLIVNCLPDNYVEIMNATYDEESGLTKEEIHEELTELGFVCFPYSDEDLTLEKVEIHNDDDEDEEENEYDEL